MTRQDELKGILYRHWVASGAVRHGAAVCSHYKVVAANSVAVLVCLSPWDEPRTQAISEPGALPATLHSAHGPNVRDFGSALIFPMSPTGMDALIYTAECGVIMG